MNNQNDQELKCIQNLTSKQNEHNQVGLISSSIPSWTYDNAGISLSQRKYEPFMWCQNMTHVLQITNRVQPGTDWSKFILFSRKKS